MTARVIRSNAHALAKIVAREEFTNSGRSLSAQWFEIPAFVRMGIAREEVRAAIRALADGALYGQRRVYVVYSYATPIAWAVEGETLLTVPDVRYSVTTSRHQSLVMGGTPLTSDGRRDYSAGYVKTGERVTLGDPAAFRKGRGRTPIAPRLGW